MNDENYKKPFKKKFNSKRCVIFDENLFKDDEMIWKEGHRLIEVKFRFYYIFSSWNGKRVIFLEKHHKQIEMVNILLLDTGKGEDEIKVYYIIDNNFSTWWNINKTCEFIGTISVFKNGINLLGGDCFSEWMGWN